MAPAPVQPPAGPPYFRSFSSRLSPTFCTPCSFCQPLVVDTFFAGKNLFNYAGIRLLLRQRPTLGMANFVLSWRPAPPSGPLQIPFGYEPNFNFCRLLIFGLALLFLLLGCDKIAPAPSHPFHTLSVVFSYRQRP